MDKLREDFQPRGTAPAVVSPPWLGCSPRISLCSGCFQPLPWLSASLPCQLDLLLLHPQLVPSCSRLPSLPSVPGPAGFTAGHHLQLLETRPASIDPREACSLCASSKGPLSVPWHCRICFPEVVSQGGVAVNSSSNAGDNSGSLAHLQSL